MRVIAGKYRGRPLRSLARDGHPSDVGPAAGDAVQRAHGGQSAALEGSVWLDLFAGTGAVGIEALSRGAKQVHFVETLLRGGELDRAILQSLGIGEGFNILQR